MINHFYTMQNAAIEKNLYPKLTKSLEQLCVEFPAGLLKNFTHILQRTELFWGEKEAVDYLESLLIENGTHDNNSTPSSSQSVRTYHSDRTTRQGFPGKVVKEIILLKQAHQQLFISQSASQMDHFYPFDTLRTVGIPNQHSNTDNQNPVNNPRHINWPIIQTQHELFEYAELQQRGENLHLLQGKLFGEILTHYGVIDEHTLRVINDMQKRPSHSHQPIGELLVEIGIINQDELIRLLNIQIGIPMVDVLSIDISSETINTIPNAVAREKLIIPVGHYHGTLYLAVSDPISFVDHAYFAVTTGMKVRPVFAPKLDILNRLNIFGSYMNSSGVAKEKFRNLAKSDLIFSPEKTTTLPPDVSENDSIIVNLVNQMILSAIKEEASDIHIELFNDNEAARIRFRRDGHMTHFSDFPRVYHKAVVSRIKIMSELDISEMRRPQDGKISFNIPSGNRVDLRVSTIPARPGVEFVTIRILSSGEPLPLGVLGMTNKDVNVFRDLFKKPYGLILVCGPTGSGKTTTLHSVLKELNTEDRKIWTAEDPVEIVQPHLCQVHVNSKVGMTFATVLRSLLRADPDVIMIGEMRDHESAKIALEASMTGHLVLSTLHTNSSTETVARLLDLGIDPYNLSDALLVILAQRLARKLCTFCATQEEVSLNEIEDLACEYFESAHHMQPTVNERYEIIQRWQDSYGINGKFYLKHAVGCKECREGYKGRIGLYELLHTTPQLRHLIRQQSAASEYMKSGVADGMLTLKQDGIEKVMAGITDMVQVHRACI
jgi:type II secretory ATPase GspE/PulE/Tfp pilus assembly ATPase PilB-like protein